MKPAPFQYFRPRDVEEATAVLGELGDDAKVLSGGQSLVPMLNFRLARPTALVDIGELDELRSVQDAGSWLRVGSLVTHRAVETASGLAPPFRILRHTASLIGHYPIRVRGTIGGSLAHADAAAEWCLVAVVLQAELVVASTRGRRHIAATDFFLGTLETALEPDELIVEVRFPTPAEHAQITEVARRSGDFATVAVAVALDVADGRVRSAQVGLGGVADTVVRVPEAEQVLADADVSGAEMPALREAAHVAARAVDPPADLHASAAHRRRLTGVLVERALRASAEAQTGHLHERGAQ